MIYKANNEFLGFAGLKYLEDLQEVDLGYRLKKTYWGKGIATEASIPSLEFGFNDLDLNRIIATVMPENTASVNVLNKLGFSFEKEEIKDGDTVAYYAIVKPA